jgi:hypothetical protein
MKKFLSKAKPILEAIKNIFLFFVLVACTIWCVAAGIYYLMQYTNTRDVVSLVWALVELGLVAIAVFSVTRSLIVSIKRHKADKKLLTYPYCHYPATPTDIEFAQQTEKVLRQFMKLANVDEGAMNDVIRTSSFTITVREIKAIDGIPHAELCCKIVEQKGKPAE